MNASDLHSVAHEPSASALPQGGAAPAGYHQPVLLEESVEGLGVKAGGVYVDVTYGGGGHSREVLRRVREADAQAAPGTRGHLYSFDQDTDVLQNIDGEMTADGRFTFVRGNFRYMRNFLRWEGVGEVDGVLADLGVSSHHFDDSERGFSFRFDAPLDMRMNRYARTTAAQVVNKYAEEQLANVLYLYGEVRQSRQLAAAIVRRRAQAPIETTGQLAQLVGTDDKKLLAKVFQALRIEVNQEMTALESMLRQSVALLRPGGRLAVITYHSLEDRMVKNLIRTGDVGGRENKDFYGRVSAPLRAVTRGVVTPSAEEQARNPRSRSAKLRVAEKVG